MAGYVKLEQRKVTQYKDGAVYKTKVLGYKWFKIEEQPTQYEVDKNDIMWVATSDYHFGKDYPTT